MTSYLDTRQIARRVLIIFIRCEFTILYLTSSSFTVRQSCCSSSIDTNRYIHQLTFNTTQALTKRITDRHNNFARMLALTRFTIH